MNVRQGYYKASTLQMLQSGETDRDTALAVLAGVTVNGTPLDGFADPLVNCMSGTVSLSNEGLYTPSLSSFFDSGTSRLDAHPDAGDTSTYWDPI